MCGFACVADAELDTRERTEPLTDPSISSEVIEFHFDEQPGSFPITFEDRSPLHVNATCANGTACPGVGGTGLAGTVVHSNVRRAADFNGSSDCITMSADRTEHSLNSTAGISISVWIYPRGLPANGEQSIIASKYDPNLDNREWMLGFRNVGGATRLAFWKSHTGKSINTEITYADRVWDGDASDGDSDLNKWWHVVFRMNTAATPSWYLNTVSVPATASFSNTTFFNGTSKVRIGCSATSAAPGYFYGKIDELRVARRYFTVTTDIYGLYSWSVPPAPTVAYAAGTGWELEPQFDHCGGDMLQKPIDPVELKDRLDAANATDYEFGIRRWCRYDGARDFAQLIEFLKLLEQTSSKLRVTLYRNPLWYDISPEGIDDTNEFVGPSCMDKPAPTKWACAVTKLAVRFPSNFKGWLIDDFFAEKNGQAGYDSFLKRSHLVSVCQEFNNPAYRVDANDPSPVIDLGGVIYQRKMTSTDLNAINAYADGWPSAATLASGRWSDAMRDYLQNGADATVVRNCLKNVHLYVGPSDLDDPVANPPGALNLDLDKLRPFQVSAPPIRLIQGIYVGDTGLGAGLVPNLPVDNAGGCLVRAKQVDAARLTVPDGFAIYEFPSDDPVLEPLCEAPYAKYSFLDPPGTPAGLRALFANPPLMITY